ncbi:hypothetical protein [Microvirga sp. Mcv34]|uniref:hypothetical protein n=1 Tax=Microvirga sp. Mcv34 TaxID=2926016 RepID=UPI0021CAE050|nr:hypothetical protein [Microvirga sp. Mcv34]
MKLPKKWRKRYETRVKELHEQVLDTIDSFEETYERLKGFGANIPGYHEQSQELRSVLDASRDVLLQEQDYELLWQAQDALFEKARVLTGQVTGESDRIFRETFGCEPSDMYKIQSVALQ